jgi:MFS family permease
MNEIEQRQSKRTLPITSAATFLGFLDTTMLVPVMALYAANLGASVSIIGLVIGLYSIVNTPANIFFGRLIDSVGAKVPLIAGLLGDALAMFFYALSRSPVHLALVRAFHGATGAAVGPATMSLIAGHDGQRRKGRAMGIYGMSLAAANLVGFGLSGVIVSRFGYKVLFLIGTGLLSIGALLSLLLPGGQRKGVVSGGTSSGATFSQIKGLLGRRGLNVAYATIFAQYFTFGGVVTLLPIYVRNLGMEAFHVGMLLTTFAVMFILIQFLSGALSDRIGRLMPTVIGLTLGIVSLVILPQLATFPLLAMGMALYGLAYGILFPSISALVIDHTVIEERGLASGIFHALLTTGVAIGAPVIGWVGGVVGVQLGMMLTSAVMALALVLALTALRRT